jgi:hypothetical protein
VLAPCWQIQWQESRVAVGLSASEAALLASSGRKAASSSGGPVSVRAMADTGDDDGLGLDEVLAALRHDLLAAQRDSDGENTGLAVREVEIELSVEVSRRVDARGEVSAKWFVLSGSASGEGSRERRSTNKITLTLGPVATGKDDGPTTAGGPVAGSDVSAGVIPRAVAENQDGT